jgi:hypothetical protein
MEYKLTESTLPDARHEKADTCHLQLQQQLIQRFRDLLKRQYDVELSRVVVDQPPRVGLGEGE